MITNIIEDNKYKELMKIQIKDVIFYLLEHNEEFSITANVKGCDFNPQIPSSISDKFSKFTMFALTNYTYSTILVTDEYISFEAGFGAENFGSIVTVPLHAIFQIVVNDSILFVNPTATVEKYFISQNNEVKKVVDKKKRSRSAFLNNPKNKDFI
jgi:hypothetical protein